MSGTREEGGQKYSDGVVGRWAWAWGVVDIATAPWVEEELYQAVLTYQPSAKTSV